MLPVAVVTFAGTDETCLVETATIRHGRDDPTSQPEADAATFTIWGAPPAGVDIGVPVTITAVLGGVSYPRFVGEVTDLSISWDAVDRPVSQIIAVGSLARMGYRIAGVDVWPSELDGARAGRAITAAGVPRDDGRTDPGTLRVVARAPDPQPALQIAQEAAQDGAGILWQSKDGAVLYADADHRRDTPAAVNLDACTIPLDVTWTKSLEGLINDLRVTWGGPDVAGLPAPPPVPDEVIGSYGPLPPSRSLGNGNWPDTAYQRVRVSADVDVSGVNVFLAGSGPAPTWQAWILLDDGTGVATGPPTPFVTLPFTLPVSAHLDAGVDYRIQVQRVGPLGYYNELIRLGLRPDPPTLTGVFVTPAAGELFYASTAWGPFPGPPGHHMVFELVGHL